MQDGTATGATATDTGIDRAGIDRADIAGREAQILGQPPRVPPLGPGEFSEEALALTGRLRQIGSGRPPPTSMDDVPEIVAIMLRHPDLYDKLIGMGIQVAPKGLIPFRERELAILRIGWLCRAPFEWGEHVKKGRQAELTTEEIERITIGAAAPGWNEHDRAILSAVDELFADAMISDATWATLARTYDYRQLIELPSLIGHYQGIAYSQNSLRIRLNDGNIGLRAR